MTDTFFAKATKKRSFVHQNIFRILSGKLQSIRLRRLRFRKAHFLPIIGGIGFIVAMWIFFVSSLFKVKHIHCNQDEQPCQQYILSQTSAFIGRHIMFLNQDIFIREQLFVYPSLSSIVLKKQLPDTLVITMSNRKAISVIQDSSGKQYLIDNQRKVFAEGGGEGLPIILTQETVTVGEEAVSSSILAAIELQHTLARSYIPVITITIDQNDLTAHLGSGIIVLINPQRSIIKQVDALQFILNNSKIDKNVKITTVDLRFDNPVIK